jgi:16S rRNA (cytosine967-C5)-methyltransferase
MVYGRAPPARAVGVKKSPAPSRRPPDQALPGLAARVAATAAFRRVIEDGAKLDDALDDATGGLAGADLALARVIVATALRRLADIEQALARHLNRPLPTRAGLTRAILVTAAAQLLYMRVPAHAAIDLAVRQAKADRKAFHQAGLVNAVLRQVDRTPPGQAVTPGSNIPEPFGARWRARWGDDAFAALAAELVREPPLDLSVKDDAAGWAERLGARVLATGSLRIDAPRGAIETLPGFSEGAWWVQDAAAALPVQLLGDVAGRRVLDLFAAPGGKTAQLAAAGARVTAVDISPTRLRRLRHNLARLRLQAELVAADALHYSAPEPFDAVLVDAPCSATGTARRNPDVVYHRSLADIASLARLQAEALAHAAGLVRPGGLMVYCTCSLESEEGEAQMARFLAERPDFQRVPVAAGEIGGLFHLIDPDGDVRSLPGQAIDGAGSLDGFFIARARRQRSSLSDR